ncbi:MAG: hypothetical protein ACRDHP_19635, partial [Ktedonobacterales bacterium]
MAETTDEDDEETAWPDDLLDAGEVRAWIASALPGNPVAAGPVRVYAAKEWGVTARFDVTPGDGSGGSGRDGLPESAVFKASLLPLFASAPHVAALLTRHCSGIAPELLAWSPVEAGGAWMLFAPFAGVTAEALPGIEPLLAMAHTLADIQAAIAELSEGETADIPRVPPREFPAMLDAVLADIRARHLAFWRGEGRDLATQFALPDDVAARRERERPRVVAWADELEASGWPLALDHVDLQPDNAVLQPDGRMLL